MVLRALGIALTFNVLVSAQTARPYKTVDVALSNCVTKLPPVRDWDGHATQNVRALKPDHLCRAVTALKAWIESVPASPEYVQAGDWNRVASIDIVRQRTISPSGNAPGFQIDLYVDVPGRRNLLGLTFIEDTGETKPFTVHR